MSESRYNTAAAREIKPLTYPIIGAAIRLGVGRTKFYELLAAKEIRQIQIGGMPRIPESELQRYLAKQSEAVE
ncbi:excisionase family DNA-binding protein [Luteimonas mephitis]|uniref:excisionase family DNA-binding protein n=1 Tax=Luteimonas mephitis TaxID=83615 RepID=UPI003A9306C3